MKHEKELEDVPLYRFGTDAPERSLSEHFQFELRCALGSFLSPKVRQPRNKLLHIGSGDNVLPGFENLDVYFKYLKRRLRQPFASRPKHIGHDLRKPLPYEDNSFEGAFSEHTLEHLYPRDAINLLRQAFRVLKPGGVFRCTVPDLRMHVRFYMGELPDEEFTKFESGCEAIWYLTQHHRHLSVWDAEMLKSQLLRAGFAHVAERAFGEGGDPRLLHDQEAQRWCTIYVEAVK